jgi:hypothetical protein
MIGGKVHWGAVAKGLETTVALSFLYMIRCSIHGTALKKNIPTLSRVEKMNNDPVREAIQPLALSRKPTVVRAHHRKFSEALDIDGTQQERTASAVAATAMVVVTAKPTKASLKAILTQYGYSQLISGLVGGFAVIPCVATAPTMFMVWHYCLLLYTLCTTTTGSLFRIACIVTARSGKTCSTIGCSSLVTNFLLY